jgi:hypothetical protein
MAEPMSYRANDFTVLAYTNGFTLWHYRTADETASLFDAGYFDRAAEMLREGDIIIVNAVEAGQPDACLALVKTNALGAVEVAKK